MMDGRRTRFALMLGIWVFVVLNAPVARRAFGSDLRPIDDALMVLFALTFLTSLLFTFLVGEVASQRGLRPGPEHHDTVVRRLQSIARYAAILLPIFILAILARLLMARA